MSDTTTDSDLQTSFEEKNTALTRTVKYATFNMRMFAAIVDVSVVLIIAFPLGSFIDGWVFPPVNYTALGALSSPDISQDDKVRLMMQFMSDQHMIARMMFTNFFQIALFALYILPCWIRYNNTPGKMLVGIEIRDASTYALMTKSQMIKRFIGYIISGIPLTLGFVWMAFNKKKQCWHDKIAGTIVVVKEKRPFSLALRSASR